MPSNIPRELRRLDQWVCFDVEGSNKIAYTPGTDKHAASNRPAEWRSFEEALADVESGKRQHFGFAFSSTDPFTFIDLDDIEDEEQQGVFERIDTFAQRSVSGRGVHLIARGSFDGQGRHPKKPHAGIFKEGRFCLMTGNVVPNRTKIKEVADEDLQRVHTWLSGGVVNGKSVRLNEDIPDIPHATIYQWGCDVFGTKYREMCRGNWEQYAEYFNDHSTADYAFIAMLCDLTDSDPQVRDLFYMSGMWSDERAQKKAAHGPDGYVNRSIKKARASKRHKDEQRAKVQLDFRRVSKVEVVEEAPEDDEAECLLGDTSMIENIPDGLIKDMAWHTFKASHLPLQEAAVCVAISTMSVLAGRGHVTPSDEGLNLWPILIGGTGCGKGGYKLGIKRLLEAVGVNLPATGRLLKGPVTSFAGLHTAFKTSLRQISYNPEFGGTFNNLANGGDNTVTAALRQGIMDVFDLAGADGSYEGRRTADNVGELFPRPFLLFAGETTPEVLYGGLTSSAVLSGFIQRFMLINVADASLSRPRRGDKEEVPEELASRLYQVALRMDKLDVTNDFSRVRVSKQADTLLWDYANDVLTLMRKEKANPILAEIKNRSAAKASRLASLLAVAANPLRPRIEKEHATWSIKLMEKLDRDVTEKFLNGEVSTGQVKQEAEILKAMEKLSTMSVVERKKFHIAPGVIRSRKLCPYTAIKKIVLQHASFNNDRSGAITALNNRLLSLVNNGEIVQVSESDAADLGEPGKKIYYLAK